MHEIKCVGFFENVDEVTNLVAETAMDEELLIVDYLNGGHNIVLSGSWADDLLRPAEPIAQFAVQTDGSWIWPSTLARYVQKYHVRLPDDFLDHMRASGWSVPLVSQEAMSDAQVALMTSEE